jgi:hypothetical protein
MNRHKLQGWALGVLAALALGAVASRAVIAAQSKEKVVHHTGIVKEITPSSIKLQEHHFMSSHVGTYPLASSPTVTLISGGAGSTSDIAVGSKVSITGTQAADKSVTVNEIKVLAVPKMKK